MDPAKTRKGAALGRNTKLKALEANVRERFVELLARCRDHLKAEDVRDDMNTALRATARAMQRDRGEDGGTT